MIRRCQRNSVSGLRRNACHERPGSTRLSAARSSRSLSPQLRAPRLPPPDRQLVAQNEELEFLRAVATREQQDEREQPAGNDVDERHEHRQPPKTGAPTLSRLPANRPPVPHHT